MITFSYSLHLTFCFLIKKSIKVLQSYLKVIITTKLKINFVTWLLESKHSQVVSMNDFESVQKRGLKKSTFIPV